MRRIQDPSQQNSEGGWRSGRCGNQQRKARERQFRCDHRRSGRTDRFSPWNETTLSGAQGALHGRNHRKSPRSAPRVSRRPTDGRGVTNACLHLGLLSEARREWHGTAPHTSRRPPSPAGAGSENDGVSAFRPNNAVSTTRHERTVSPDETTTPEERSTEL